MSAYKGPPFTQSPLGRACPVEKAGCAFTVVTVCLILSGGWAVTEVGGGALILSVVRLCSRVSRAFWGRCYGAHGSATTWMPTPHTGVRVIVLLWKKSLLHFWPSFSWMYLLGSRWCYNILGFQTSCMWETWRVPGSWLLPGLASPGCCSHLSVCLSAFSIYI